MHVVMRVICAVKRVNLVEKRAHNAVKMDIYVVKRVSMWGA